MLPWFTVREVAVDIEIVRFFFFNLSMYELITARNSHRRKWPSFGLNVACSKVSWRELAEVRSWNIMCLGSYRMFPSC